MDAAIDTETDAALDTVTDAALDTRMDATLDDGMRPEASVDDAGRCHEPSPNPRPDAFCPAAYAEVDLSAALATFCASEARGLAPDVVDCGGIVAYRITNPDAWFDTRACYYDAATGELVATEVCSDTRTYCQNQSWCSLSGAAVPACVGARPTRHSACGSFGDGGLDGSTVDLASPVD